MRVFHRGACAFMSSGSGPLSPSRVLSSLPLTSSPLTSLVIEAATSLILLRDFCSSAIAFLLNLSPAMTILRVSIGMAPKDVIRFPSRPLDSLVFDVDFLSFMSSVLPESVLVDVFSISSNALSRLPANAGKSGTAPGQASRPKSRRSS